MKKFAFLIHPRDISDVARPIPAARFIPKGLLNFMIGKLPKKLDVYPWRTFDVYGKAEGCIIVVFLTGEQMVALPRNYVQERILEAVLFAQDQYGADIVGLGAYTAPLTDAGRWLVRQNKVKVNITHGDSFSVAIAAQGVNKILNDYKLDGKKIEIAIVGAYGLIGKSLSGILAKKYEKMLLVGRKELKLESLKRELGKSTIRISTDIASIVNSDVIVTATSYPGSLMKSEYLKNGAIIYDIAQPVNVLPSVCAERPDITRIDGCYAKIPDINLKVDMGPPTGTTFSCLAETIMQALENDHGNYVGEINLDHVSKTIEWQKKYGFEHAAFTNFSEPLTLNA